MTPRTPYERSPYRVCTRCGLAPRVDDQWTCFACTRELDVTAFVPGIAYRKCPVCKKSMDLVTRPDARPTLSCICGAAFDSADARLCFPGCERTGKGTVGTNQMVRNDARRILEQREQEAREVEIARRPERIALREVRRERRREYDAALTNWRVHRQLPLDVTDADVLLVLVEQPSDESLQKEALIRLYELQAADQLRQIVDSRSRWATSATSALRRLGES